MQTTISSVTTTTITTKRTCGVLASVVAGTVNGITTFTTTPAVTCRRKRQFWNQPIFLALNDEHDDAHLQYYRLSPSEVLRYSLDFIHFHFQINTIMQILCVRIVWNRLCCLNSATPIGNQVWNWLKIHRWVLKRRSTVRRHCCRRTCDWTAALHSAADWAASSRRSCRIFWCRLRRPRLRSLSTHRHRPAHRIRRPQLIMSSVLVIQAVSAPVNNLTNRYAFYQQLSQPERLLFNRLAHMLSHHYLMPTKELSSFF